MSVLGNAFHALDRTKISIKHEAKKAFFVVLRDAWLVWNEDKKQELEANMKAANMTDGEIETMRYHSPAIYHGCVDCCVPPPG